MDRRIAEHVHDPYKTRLKLPEPTVCPDCGATYHEGRWHWPAYEPSRDTHRERCQACHRIHDGYPAGWLTLAGGFVCEHRGEIERLARHIEAQEKAEHPLHRIMDMREENGGLVITTTDIHLPRRIGEGLYDAYRGKLDFHYDEESYLLRVRWTRED